MADANVLLVEGPEEWNVLWHLLKKSGYENRVELKRSASPRPSGTPHAAAPTSIAVKEKGGITPLMESLTRELRASDLERFGVIVDADASLESRWQSLRDTLTNYGYDAMPDQPEPDGTVVEADDLPRIGLWVMPDNKLPGKLENFVEFLVPPGDALWMRAGACLQQVPIAERLFSELDYIKAHVHTWLAWQKEPGTPIGRAITMQYLDSQSPHAARLTAWLARLYQFNG